MSLETITKEFGIPVLALMLFFALQARGSMSELGLTFFIAGVSSLLFNWHSRIAEVYLYGIGTAVGIFIEIGFRFLGYQQTWTDASLFGIPFWLPLAWGMGFVLITRFGMYVRSIPAND
jgi:hypothetical protein